MERKSWEAERVRVGDWEVCILRDEFSKDAEIAVERTLERLGVKKPTTLDALKSGSLYQVEVKPVRYMYETRLLGYVVDVSVDWMEKSLALKPYDISQSTLPSVPWDARLVAQDEFPLAQGSFAEERGDWRVYVHAGVLGDQPKLLREYVESVLAHLGIGKSKKVIGEMICLWRDGFVWRHESTEITADVFRRTSEVVLKVHMSNLGNNSSNSLVGH